MSAAAPPSAAPAPAAGDGDRAAADWVIDVRNLRKSFAGREVVHGIALRVRRGEIYGFLGPNGSGKTTTIRMLCGLLTPDAGEGHCLGYDILRESRSIKLHVGYMTQQFSLYGDLTVLENLAFMARVHGMPRPLALARRTARDMGLADRMDQLAGTLSGGWKQRLALAACTLHEPELLLLDEPTAGVDPRARRDFWDSIHALAARGITVLVSTHYMDEAERCHELAYIHDGVILAHGPVRDIVARSGLAAWALLGDQATLNRVASGLQRRAEVEIATFRGEELHLAGRDGAALRGLVEDVCRDAGLACRPAAPTLEDVFIHFMNAAGEHDGAAAPDGTSAAPETAGEGTP
ncbi:MAG TPA: ABC transporter ATP-binding protein [Bryobacterales bacterium]|nr:ABC transporter ATP-binding protein [Bryobacterales bacterium]